MMEIEIGAALRALRKLFWVPIALMVAFGLLAGILASQRADTYTATSTIMVSQSSATSTGPTSLAITKTLADTYKLLVDTDDFQNMIADAAGVDSIEDFDIVISAPAGSSLIEIAVTHEDPEAALNVATATVDVMLADQKARAHQQSEELTSNLSVELESLREDRSALEQELAALDPDDDSTTARRFELTGNIDRLTARIGDTQQRIDQIGLDFQLNQPNLVPVTNSSPPETPNNLSPILFALIGVFLGGVIGAAVILFWAVTHDVVSNPGKYSEDTNTRFLGEIPNAGSLTEGANQVFLLAKPTESPAEGIRMLVTNLDFAEFPGENNHVLQVTSPGPANGKSTTAANLAVHYAQLGKRVMLIDCDLHRPSLHQVFSVKNNLGFVNLLMDRTLSVKDVAERVALPGLFLLPSGPLTSNPAELFSSPHFSRLIEQLKIDFDVVILDSPPILLFSDSQRIAARSDSVILVARLDSTKKPEIDQALQSIGNTGTPLIGTVWVGSKPSRNHYYYRRGRRSRLKGR